MRGGVLIFGILMAIVLAVSVVPLQAGPPTPRIDPWEWKRDLMQRPASLVFPSPAHRASQSAPPSDVSPAEALAPMGTGWARIVFQSFRNEHDWDIYIAGAKAENPVRLTSHEAHDVEPHLNKGATRVAFASNRDGDYEIYTMRPDGSDVRQLTFNTISDRRPMWSPDGARIAFYACQGNACDVYVMNADGSNRQRLTYDGVSFDPSWSPDGQKIVFARYGGGQDGIWVMNADGTNAYRIASHPYAQHPVWSPDGMRIAYDADADSDGFNEPMVVNADGSSPRMVYNPDPGLPYYNELWADSWLFDPDDSGYYMGPHYLAFTHLILFYYQGNWYWVEAYLGFVDANCYGCTGVQLTYTGTDWHAMSQATDNQPPTAWLAPLPQYSRYDQVRIAWQGEDAGPAELAFYDVQVRRNNGPWTDWKTWEYDDNSDIFSGTSGDWVEFRARAWDRAYNVSPWTPAQGTWLYAYEISGDVRDTRSIPLARSQVTLTAPLVGPIGQTPWGTYQAHLRDGGQTRLAASALGYGTGYPVTPTVGSDLKWSFYLPPTDNQILNGDFEDPERLTGWETGGISPPVVTTETFHTGSAAALLVANQEPQWSTPEVISGGMGSQPDMEVTPDGSVHIAYIRNGALHYRYRSPQGTWSSPVVVTDNATSPAIAVSPSGEVHLVWQSSNGVYYTRRAPGATWDSPTLLRQDGSDPDIATDNLGNVHIAYTAKDYGYGWYLVNYTFYISRTVTGEWGTTQKFAAESVSPAIAAQSPDKVIVAVGGRQAAFCTPWNEPGWSGAWLCEYTSWGMSIDDLEIDSQGVPHAVGRVEGWYCLYMVGGALQVTQLPDCASETSLAIDGSNNLYIVNVAPAEHAILWRYKPYGGTWSAPRRIAEHENVEAPELEVGPDGNLQLLYVNGPTTNIYQTGIWLPQADSTLSQTIVLPSSLHRPTLSFLYRLEGWGGQDAERFAVNVTSATGTTTVFSATQNTADWTHQWIDLSPWAGEVITVAFTAQSQTHLTSARIALDEVTIGSWRTPLSRAAHPNPVEPYISVPITVTGENFLEGATLWIDGVPLTTNWLDSTQQTATIPGTLSLGMHLLEVQNPGGQTVAVPGGLVVGRQVFLPLVLRRAFSFP